MFICLWRERPTCTIVVTCAAGAAGRQLLGGGGDVPPLVRHAAGPAVPGALFLRRAQERDGGRAGGGDGGAARPDGHARGRPVRLRHLQRHLRRRGAQPAARRAAHLRQGRRPHPPRLDLRRP